MKILYILPFFTLMSCVYKIPKGKPQSISQNVPQSIPQVIPQIIPQGMPLGFSLYISEIKKSVNNDDIFIVLSFINNTKTKVRLLDYFDPIYAFFSFIFTDKVTGQSSIALPLGRIDFEGNQIFNYVDIYPEKIYKKELNISQILREYNVSMPTGLYQVKITYNNHSGINCITGIFRSNVIEVNVGHL